MKLKEALYWKADQSDKIRCQLCPQQCLIAPDKSGLCRVRKNIDGVLYSLNYGEITALALDPIEKKPLYHFYPGSSILSAGSFGCNLKCQFCQNFEIAHGDPATRTIFPEELNNIALRCVQEGSIGLAFTYNEPLMSYEYIKDLAPLLKQAGMKTVMVSNGFIEKEPLKALLPLIDAWNIDLKAFNPGFYQSVCKGKMENVKETIAEIAGQAHLEITTLIIPGLNDNKEEISALAHFLARLDPDIVLHLSAYYPAYNFKIPPSSAVTMKKCQDWAKEELSFVYLGNLAGIPNDTPCLACGAPLIHRSGYHVETKIMEDYVCPHCGNKIDYIEGL